MERKAVPSTDVGDVTGASSKIPVNIEVANDRSQLQTNERRQYVTNIGGIMVPITTAIFPRSNPRGALLAGGVAAIAYALHRLRYNAGPFYRGSITFDISTEPDKEHTVRRRLENGTFLQELREEVKDIIEEHSDILGDLTDFTIISCKEIRTKAEKGKNISHVAEVMSDDNGGNDASTSNNSVLEPSRSQTQHPEDDTTLTEDALYFQPTDMPADTGSASSSLHGTSDPRTSDPRTSDPRTSDPRTSVPGTSDTGTSDTGTSDTGTSDTGTSDTGTSDTGTSDTGTSDSGTKVPGTNVQGTSNHQSPYKYHVGIFSNNQKIARQVTEEIGRLGYRSCVYEHWLYPYDVPIPEKCMHFIDECMLIFWIASPCGDTGYMNQAKNVAHHDCITSRPYRSFIVVIPEEHSGIPITEIVPRELQTYEPMKEDDQINKRIKITIEYALKKCKGCSDVDTQPPNLVKTQQQQSTAPENLTYNIQHADVVIVSSIIRSSNIGLVSGKKNAQTVQPDEIESTGPQPNEIQPAAPQPDEIQPAAPQPDENQPAAPQPDEIQHSKIS